MKKLLFLLSFNILLLISNYSFCQWEQTSVPPSGSIFSIAISGTNIFVGSVGLNGAIYLSTDNGATWNNMNNGLLPDYYTYTWSLAISGNGNVFAGTLGEGVYVSTNNGASWSDGVNDLNAGYVISLAISGNGNVFAGTLMGGAVYLSTDNGTTWSDANTGLTTSNGVYSLVISGDSIFAGTDEHGVFLSTDNGSVWTSLGLPNYTVYSLAISGDSIFAGTNGHGVYLSTDKGTSWNAMNKGLTDTTGVSSLAISGRNIFAGTKVGGVFLSTNNGTMWNYVGLTGNYIRSLAINETNVFAGTDKSGLWEEALSDLITDASKMKIDNGEWRIYPNPATSYLYVSSSKPQVSSLTNKYVLTLRNIEGQEVVKKNVEFSNLYKLDLTNITNGIYFLTLQNDEENYVRKVVIQQ